MVKGKGGLNSPRRPGRGVGGSSSTSDTEVESVGVLVCLVPRGEVKDGVGLTGLAPMRAGDGGLRGQCLEVFR